MRKPSYSLHFAILLTLLFTWLTPAQAQCPEGYVDEQTSLDAALAELKSTLDEKIESARTTGESRITSEKVETTPRARPSSEQITAPATGTSDSTTLVAGAGETNFLALALEGGVFETADGKVTLNLNPFALRVLANPQTWTDQQKYQESKTLRKFSATVSFGGKGEKLDRDGDGKADEPAEAKNIDDIVSWELRYRPSESRDRREEYNWKIFQGKTTEALSAVGATEVATIARLNRFIEPRRFVDENGETLQCVPKDFMKALLERPEVIALIHDLVIETAERQGEHDGLWKAAAEEVSKRWVTSLVIGGVERKDDFGPDKLYAVFRGDKGIANNKMLKFEVMWMETEALAEGTPDPRMISAGLEWATLCFKGSELFGEKSFIGQNGLELSFAGTWEHFEDVPDAKHDTVSKLGVKFEFPFNDALKLPISITWANHKDLLSDEDEIVGHIGLSWDVSKLLKKADS